MIKYKTMYLYINQCKNRLTLIINCNMNTNIKFIMEFENILRTNIQIS